ncbi:hypothetical protein BU23DRAFT_548961 [Bimuria novae-zelandiae CBS 107.79]|uniref:Uncharacterized protein n=1 Tax=Bimuria novae-zelandiae CBS 107.79 TaxID=1447943 RepID=A0A6A5VR85_9PLEO|nr:hypothetical protein BU23DRAFT_548961 [Bimuria novae-zelandiae CBS 107.79]
MATERISVNYNSCLIVSVLLATFSLCFSSTGSGKSLCTGSKSPGLFSVGRTYDCFLGTPPPTGVSDSPQQPQQPQRDS